eukprot:gene182-2977_t
MSRRAPGAIRAPRPEDFGLSAGVVQSAWAGSRAGPAPTSGAPKKEKKWRKAPDCADISLMPKHKTGNQTDLRDEHGRAPWEKAQWTHNPKIGLGSRGKQLKESTGASQYGKVSARKPTHPDPTPPPFHPKIERTTRKAQELADQPSSGYGKKSAPAPKHPAPELDLKVHTFAPDLTLSQQSKRYKKVQGTGIHKVPTAHFHTKKAELLDKLYGRSECKLSKTRVGVGNESGTQAAPKITANATQIAKALGKRPATSSSSSSASSSKGKSKSGSRRRANDPSTRDLSRVPKTATIRGVGRSSSSSSSSSHATALVASASATSSSKSHAKKKKKTKKVKVVAATEPLPAPSASASASPAHTAAAAAAAAAPSTNSVEQLESGSEEEADTFENDSFEDDDDDGNGGNAITTAETIVPSEATHIGDDLIAIMESAKATSAKAAERASQEKEAALLRTQELEKQLEEARKQIAAMEHGGSSGGRRKSVQMETHEAELRQKAEASAALRSRLQKESEIVARRYDANESNDGSESTGFNPVDYGLEPIEKQVQRQSRRPSVAFGSAVPEATSSPLAKLSASKPKSRRRRNNPALLLDSAALDAEYKARDGARAAAKAELEAKLKEDVEREYRKEEAAENNRLTKLANEREALEKRLRGRKRRGTAISIAADPADEWLEGTHRMKEDHIASSVQTPGRSRRGSVAAAAASNLSETIPFSDALSAAAAAQTPAPPSPKLPQSRAAKMLQMKEASHRRALEAAQEKARKAAEEMKAAEERNIRDAELSAQRYELEQKKIEMQLAAEKERQEVDRLNAAREDAEVGQKAAAFSASIAAEDAQREAKFEAEMAKASHEVAELAKTARAASRKARESADVSNANGGAMRIYKTLADDGKIVYSDEAASRNTAIATEKERRASQAIESERREAEATDAKKVAAAKQEQTGEQNAAAIKLRLAAREAEIHSAAVAGEAIFAESPEEVRSKELAAARANAQALVDKAKAEELAAEKADTSAAATADGAVDNAAAPLSVILSRDNLNAMNASPEAEEISSSDVSDELSSSSGVASSDALSDSEDEDERYRHHHKQGRKHRGIEKDETLNESSPLKQTIPFEQANSPTLNATVPFNEAAPPLNAPLPFKDVSAPKAVIDAGLAPLPIDGAARLVHPNLERPKRPGQIRKPSRRSPRSSPTEDHALAADGGTGSGSVPSAQTLGHDKAAPVTAAAAEEEEEEEKAEVKKGTTPSKSSTSSLPALPKAQPSFPSLAPLRKAAPEPPAMTASEKWAKEAAEEAERERQEALRKKAEAAKAAEPEPPKPAPAPEPDVDAASQWLRSAEKDVGKLEAEAAAGRARHAEAKEKAAKAREAAELEAKKAAEAKAAREAEEAALQAAKEAEEEKLRLEKETELAKQREKDNAERKARRLQILEDERIAKEEAEAAIEKARIDAEQKAKGEAAEAERVQRELELKEAREFADERKREKEEGIRRKQAAFNGGAGGHWKDSAPPIPAPRSPSPSPAPQAAARPSPAPRSAGVKSFAVTHDAAKDAPMPAASKHSDDGSYSDTSDDAFEVSSSDGDSDALSSDSDDDF